MAKTAQTAQQKKKDGALQAYVVCGTVTGACEAAGIGRRTWYDWIRDDQTFAAAVEESKDAVADSLEQRAIERALGGSDTLMIFLLKSLRPDKFKERKESVNINYDVTPDDRLLARRYGMSLTEFMENKQRGTLPEPPPLRTTH